MQCSVLGPGSTKLQGAPSLRDKAVANLNRDVQWAVGREGRMDGGSALP